MTVSAFADTETATETVEYRSNWNGVLVYKVAFLADDSDGAFATEDVVINGYILRVDTSPSGVTAPQDQYDMTLIDSLTGVDVMGGETMNRATATIETALPKIGNAFSAVYAQTVTLTLTNNNVNDAITDVYIYVATNVPVTSYVAIND